MYSSQKFGILPFSDWFLGLSIYYGTIFTMSNTVWIIRCTWSNESTNTMWDNGFLRGTKRRTRSLIIRIVRVTGLKMPLSPPSVL